MEIRGVAALWVVYLQLGAVIARLHVGETRLLRGRGDVILLVEDPEEVADVKTVGREVLKGIGHMRVLQIDRIARVGADLDTRIGEGPQRDAVQLRAATAVGHLDVIEFVGLQTDGPSRVARGDMQGAELPLVIERRLVDASKAVDNGYHLGVTTVFLFMVAASELHLTEVDLETRLHLHRNLVPAHQLIRIFHAYLDPISGGGKRMHRDAVGDLSAWRPRELVLVIIRHAERHRRATADRHLCVASNLTRLLCLHESRARQGPQEQQGFTYDGVVSHSF